MTSFSEFLNQRLEAGGFTGEDALVGFLPLLRQVASAHLAGLVAPLQGVDAIHVENGRLWFEDGQRIPPTYELAKLRTVEGHVSAAIEVMGQYRLETQIGADVSGVVNLQIGRRGEPITQPVYLPGYCSWEHEVGHHDPLTDIFVLGLIFASLVCGLDLNDPEDLASFVQHRGNLFDLNKHLHPVLAKVIVRMTELNRHRRPQDATSLVRTLENYRDQDVDFEFDLARIPSFAKSDRRGRRATILTCLQQRLFEISRRNRLLHFRATTQTVNLTWASVPLSFDVKNVRAEQILTWGHDFRDAVTAGGQVSLNKYLRFEEALYLPGQLDEIRNEARRDQTEYGFAQLRLVVCFLRWANLKEKPPERYDSPLVLLPVRLAKTKGVRDVFTIEPIGTEAEINPVLRFYLKQLYAVDLPEFIDLTAASLDELHAEIAAKVVASEPGITVEKIDKPRINLIHAKAQRRLDQYRRRVRLSGRGVRSFLDIDYSYDRGNYHPLGLRLFQTRIVPATPLLRQIVEEIPRPRAHIVPVADPADDVKERQLYTQTDEETNPYRWEFDLCNVTLGNFHYRKMSLVRDYAVLLDQADEHAAFEAIFSLQPREVAGSTSKLLPLDDSYPIVPCDPTQASAIARARTGTHFIIQGPPGTGKSQTITNLIADFVAQGKRVLFVCEKRAALDVVYHRLRQAGLHEISCLIHDAQDDKREFIADLKAAYETFMQVKESQAAKSEDQRRKLLDGLNRNLAPLERFQSAMQSAPDQAGIPIRKLLHRAAELRELVPDLSPRDLERLPAFRLWNESRSRIDRLREHLDANAGQTILAKHPLHLLHERFGRVDRPLEEVDRLLAEVEPPLDEIRSRLQALEIPPECWDTLDKARQLVEYAGTLSFLAGREQLAVLNPKSALGKKLTAARAQHSAKVQERNRAQQATSGWRQKLSSEETEFALEQARRNESSVWRFFKPAWWRLRGTMKARYDFHAHAVRPSYSQVLAKLQTEHQAAAALENWEAETRQQFGFTGRFADFSESVAVIAEGTGKLPEPLKVFHRLAMESPRGNEMVVELSSLQPTLGQFLDRLASLLADVKDLALGQIRDEVKQIADSLAELPAFVPCLKELVALPPPVAQVLRRFPLAVDQLESAIANSTIAERWHADPTLARFSVSTQAKHLKKLEQLLDEWHSINAAVVRDRVCRRFGEQVRLSAASNAQLSAEQKERKAIYNRGRRELEHEFGKTMRFRSIRDLVGGDSGAVLNDLKPVWLMSPLSVSDALPLSAQFDVVIFDEASQLTLEEAVPAIYRAKQVIVVGDEMQLPPTRFFASKADDTEEQLLLDDGAGRTVEYELSSNSFLNHAARNLPAAMLGWHYRSRSESLISFSNAAFYQGRLLTVPEVARPISEIAGIVVASPEQGRENVGRLLERPLSFHLLQKGVYDQRRNAAEADYIAQLVRGLLADQAGHSIGVIAFSEAQQGEIDQALKRLAGVDEEFRGRLEAEWEREVDGQFVGLLVKNLENIQGDERDIVILSVCYAPGPNGKMLMNFGPINQNGGERRLNVAFSRAKKHMVVVSSIRHHAITNDYNDGARALKNYLRYAEAMSAGDLQSANRVLWEINPAESAHADSVTPDSVVDRLAERLRQQGYEVDRDVGQSEFRCDLAVRRAGEPRYRLGILVDTDRYYQNDNLLERDVLRPRLLREFGWTIARVLTKDWLDNPEGVMHSIDRQLNG